MKKILFICQANVGRSQMAQGFYNSLTNSNDAISAGVEDFRLKYNYHPTEEIILAMNEAGVDISKQKIKVLNQRMLKKVNRIIVLCDKLLCPKFLLSDERVIFMTVQDLHQQGVRTIRAIRNQIKAIVLSLIS